MPVTTSITRSPLASAIVGDGTDPALLIKQIGAGHILQLGDEVNQRFVVTNEGNVDVAGNIQASGDMKANSFFSLEGTVIVPTMGWVDVFTPEDGSTYLVTIASISELVAVHGLFMVNRKGNYVHSADIFPYGLDYRSYDNVFQVYNAAEVTLAWKAIRLI